MTKFKWWLLRKLINKVLWSANVRHFMDILWEEAQRVYYEDNLHTRYHFLHEQLKESRDKEYLNFFIH